MTRWNKGNRRVLASAALLALLFATMPGTDFPSRPIRAQEVVTSPDTEAAARARAELATIQRSIFVSAERTKTLKTEIEALSGDRARQNAALIAAARRVKLAEIETGAIEERLTGLLTSENEVRDRLDGAGADVANLLAALQRIGKNPPPALVVAPADAIGSAQSAILLAAILPQLRARSDAVIADLRRLTDLRRAALDEKARLKANLATLFEEQLRIATLIEARKRGVARTGAELEAEEREAEALAARATSLDELIATLTIRIAAINKAAEAAAAATARTETLSSESVRLALANTERTAPAIPFAGAKGWLTLPASGVTITQFGANDGFGGRAQGLFVVTRAGAQVVAPADSWVMYKGPYLNYGQIVILNPGPGYNILLAGLQSVTANLGQFVLMGEPIGTMGSRTTGRAAATNSDQGPPTLYVELRDRDTPIDPSPWWADTANRTESG